MPDVRAREDRWRRIGITAWALIGVLILVSLGFFALLKVAPALVPFLLATVIVYLFRTPVAMLERRGLKRGLAVGVCYLVTTVGLVIAGLFIVPPLVDQVGQFIEAFPRYYASAVRLWQQLQTQYNAVTVPDWANQALLNLEDTISKQAVTWSSAIAGRVFSVGSGAVSFLFNSFLAVVVGFWILKDLDAIKREVVLLAGPKRRDEAAVVGAKVSSVLGGYLRGQAVVSAATAVLVTIGLTAVGVPYALVLGLLAGVLNIIPVVRSRRRRGHRGHRGRIRESVAGARGGPHHRGIAAAHRHLHHAARHVRASRPASAARDILAARRWHALSGFFGSAAGDSGRCDR